MCGVGYVCVCVGGEGLYGVVGYVVVWWVGVLVLVVLVCGYCWVYGEFVVFLY